MSISKYPKKRKRTRKKVKKKKEYIFRIRKNNE